MKIAFVGGGNMASALIGGLLQKGYAAADISVVEVEPAARARLLSRFGVSSHAAVGGEIAGSDVIVLAVKPQQLRAVAEALRSFLASQLVVSIAAGIRSADLSRWLGGYAHLVRAMPNTPALVDSTRRGSRPMPSGRVWSCGVTRFGWPSPCWARCS